LIPVSSSKRNARELGVCPLTKQQRDTHDRSLAEAASNPGETPGAWITVTDLGRPVQAQVIRVSHASVDVETIGGNVWRFYSPTRELANAKFVRSTVRRERPLSKRAKAQALVDEGLADDLAEARAFLVDMGE
jgi:hypothetical protein